MKFTTGLVVRTVARVSLFISSDVHYIVFTVCALVRFLYDDFNLSLISSCKKQRANMRFN